MKNTLLFVFSAMLFSHLSAYDLLRIQHPQQTWLYGQGTIDQSVLSIRPKGIYFQYDLYLTISGKDLGFSASDSVEVQLAFDLPKEAIVNDLWLWIDNVTIMRGLILDRWTASNIYENIVKRRKDPALLMKDTPTQYFLRIYPMIGTGSRKVKISYLLPMSMKSGTVSSPIPTNILRTSKNPVTKLTTLYWPTAEFSVPFFAESKNAFGGSTRLDSVTQKLYYYGELPSNTFSGAVNFHATMNVPNNVFVAKYHDPNNANSGVFQVSFNPSKVFGINAGQKIAFLFEFDESISAYSSLSLINTFKSFILANLTSKDSFNLVFSGTQIKRIKQSGWFGGDSASIDNAFSQVSLNSILNANNLQSLITDGIDFIQTNGGTGVIWLLAGTQSYGNFSVANPAINSLKAMMNPLIPIHITDITHWNASWNFINGRYYYGNEYFYENLSRITGGSLTSYRDNSNLQSNLSSVMEQIRGLIKSFDLITRIETGFCSNRYTLSGSTIGVDVALDKTITQIGKFNGQFPFIVELAGIYRNQTYSTKITVTSEQALSGDSTIETSWAGNYILMLESQTASNNNTKLIIDASLTHRVLSKYTAFLALEPNDTLKACITCRDETGLVFVGRREEPLIPANDSLLFAYPNPFNPETKLKVKLPAGAKNSSASLQIFNLLGQVVKDLSVSSLTDDKYSEIVWQGKSNDGEAASSGIYFAVLSTPQKRVAVKLMLMK